MLKIGIRKKIVLSLSFMLISFLLISMFINKKINETYLLKEIRAQVTMLQVDTLTLRRNEKDFLLREDKKYIKRHEDNYNVFIKKINKLEDLAKKYDFMNFSGLKSNTENYEHKFIELANTMVKANQMKANYKEYNSIQNASVRAFLLIPNTETYNALIDDEMVNINNDLQNILNIQNVIGLKYSEGLKGKVRSQSHLFEEQLKKSLMTVEEEVDKTIASNERQYLIALSLFILLVISSGIFMYLSISKRFNSVLEFSNKLNDTDGLKNRFKESNNDELTPVLSNINSLLDNIEKTNTNISEKTQSVSVAIESAKNNTDEVVNGTVEQNDMVQYIAAAATELEASIVEISRSIGMIVSEINNLNTSAENGSNDVSVSNQQLQQLVSILNDSNNEINELVAVSGEIETVVGLISDIAEQTNLLALNAAIEAARAGEQGRGFAVVADEVRMLSQKTQESTDKITNLVKNIQSQVGNVSELVGESSMLGNDCSEKSQIAEGNISKIIQQASYVGELTDSIATAINQQEVANSEIGEQMNKIKDVSTKIKDDVLEVKNEFDIIENSNNELVNSTKTL